MNQADFGHAEIAQAIGFSQATISMELRHSECKTGYRHKQAGELAKARHQQKEGSKVITGVVKGQVDERGEFNNNNQRSDSKRPQPDIP